MPNIPRKIHFILEGNGPNGETLYGCFLKWGSHVESVTKDRSQVTCGRCLRNKEYRQVGPDYRPPSKTREFQREKRRREREREKRNDQQ